ncbi:MAG: MFS transporter [Herbinix sp.]|nr:MFS transporter [Herbinix sp.]
MHITYKHTKYASYLGLFTQAIVNNLTPLLFVTFQKQFGISLEKISLLIIINFGVQIITDLVSVKYVDKIGYRLAMLLANFCCFVGLTGLGIFPQISSNAYGGLVLAVVFNAIGGGIIEVVVSPVVEALPGDEKESAMSMLHSFYCWGQVSVVILSTIYFNTIGIMQWKYMSIIWALVPLFNAFLFMKVPMCALVEENERTSLKKLFTVKIFWLLFLLMICSGASELAMSQWASLFAEEGLGVSKTFGDLLGPCFFAVLMGISRTIFGFYGSKMDLRKTIAGSSFLCVISYLVAVFSPSPIVALLGCAACGFSVGIMWPGVFSLSSKYYPQGGTAMFAILALGGDIGCTTGPGVVGVVANISNNLHYGILAAVIFPTLLAICITTFNKSSRI